MKFEEVKFNNKGILIYEVPDIIFKPFQKKLIESKDQSSVKFNEHLAGQIEHEYKIDCPGNLKLFLLDAGKNYLKYFNKQDDSKINLKNLWVNYQKKYEYNPLHYHKGLLSFILIVSIPFDLKDEDNFSNTKDSRDHTNGRIMFAYETFFNGMQTYMINADKEYEGKLFMFPNTAQHTVYPFYTSDDYRITVSGNLDIVRD